MYLTVIVLHGTDYQIGDGISDRATADMSISDFMYRRLKIRKIVQNNFRVFAKIIGQEIDQKFIGFKTSVFHG
ncbi:Uncharacterised protein [Salmonella enterica subsp. enterica serovar Typhi]|nr:Uncharacterised protein [Salmonella enterica subsp. enterica serovar Typhi]